MCGIEDETTNTAEEEQWLGCEDEMDPRSMDEAAEMFETNNEDS